MEPAPDSDVDEAEDNEDEEADEGKATAVEEEEEDDDLFEHRAAAGDDEKEEEEDDELREQRIAAVYDEGGTAAVAAVVNVPALSNQRRRPTKKRSVSSSTLGQSASSSAMRGTRLAKRSGSRLAKRTGGSDLPLSDDAENAGPQHGQRASRSNACAHQMCVDLDDSQGSPVNSPVLPKSSSRAASSGRATARERAGNSEGEDGSGDVADGSGVEKMDTPSPGGASDSGSRPHRRRSAPASYEENAMFKRFERNATGRPFIPKGHRSAPAARPKPASSSSLHRTSPKPKPASSRSVRSPTPNPQQPAKKRAKAGDGLSASRVPPLSKLGDCFFEVEYDGKRCELSTDTVSNCAHPLPAIAIPHRACFRSIGAALPLSPFTIDPFRNPLAPELFDCFREKTRLCF
jgi:hypothetical protein